MRAFLSHASEDKEDFVEPLARELAEMGVAPWLDIWEIRPGDSLVRKLFEEGLDTVDAVIVVVSESSAAKPWVREELDAAVVRRITGTVRLIPVRLDDAPIPAPLRHLVWISADQTPEGIRSAAEQITDDDNINSSPHISPDGKTVAFLSQPAAGGGVGIGDAELKVFSVNDGLIRTLASFQGDRGSFSMYGWGDANHLAFISYQFLPTEVEASR